MTTCTCGCMERAPGFEQVEAGVYKGRGAGYSLVRRRHGWQVIDPEGTTIVRSPGRLLPSASPYRDAAATMDTANAYATKHAREAGHGHP